MVETYVYRQLVTPWVIDQNTTTANRAKLVGCVLIFDEIGAKAIFASLKNHAGAVGVDHQVALFAADAAGARHDIAVGDRRSIEYEYHRCALTISLVAREIDIVLSARRIFRWRRYDAVVGCVGLPIVVRQFKRGSDYIAKHSNLDSN